MMKAALMNKKVEHGKDVTDPEALAVLKTLAKQRHESVEAFRKGGRWRRSGFTSVIAACATAASMSSSSRRLADRLPQS